jgi:hypothetical protein
VTYLPYIFFQSEAFKDNTETKIKKTIRIL